MSIIEFGWQLWTIAFRNQNSNESELLVFTQPLSSEQLKNDKMIGFVRFVWASSSLSLWLRDFLAQICKKIEKLCLGSLNWCWAGSVFFVTLEFCYIGSHWSIRNLKSFKNSNTNSTNSTCNLNATKETSMHWSSA